MSYRTHLRIISVPVVLSVALLLAACSGGSGGGESAGGTTPPVPVTTKKVGVVGLNTEDGALVAFLRAEGFVPVILDGASLVDSATVNQYDYLFFPSRESDQDTSGVPYAAYPAVVTNLQGFVSKGGRMYVFDWAADYVESAFPDKIDFLGPDPDVVSNSLVGASEAVVATVTDPGLASAVGPQVMLSLEAGYAVMAGISSQAGVVQLVQGERKRENPAPNSPPDSLGQGPLVVKFSHGLGEVVFSSAGDYTAVNDALKALLRALAPK